MFTNRSVASLNLHESSKCTRCAVLPTPSEIHVDGVKFRSNPHGGGNSLLFLLDVTRCSLRKYYLRLVKLPLPMNLHLIIHEFINLSKTFTFIHPILKVRRKVFLPPSHPLSTSLNPPSLHSTLTPRYRLGGRIHRSTPQHTQQQAVKLQCHASSRLPPAIS